MSGAFSSIPQKPCPHSQLRAPLLHPTRRPPPQSRLIRITINTPNLSKKPQHYPSEPTLTHNNSVALSYIIKKVGAKLLQTRHRGFEFQKKPPTLATFVLISASSSSENLRSSKPRQRSNLSATSFADSKLLVDHSPHLDQLQVRWAVPGSGLSP